MKYQIGTFVLDVQARTLSEHDSCQHIRPKTMEVLLYLSKRAEQIISKQELLDNVWYDVSVDDGVIFQSIREIRHVFANPQIIQNFPRKGYQFTAALEDVNDTQTDKIAKTSYSKYLAITVAILSFALLVTFGAMRLSLTKPEDSQYLSVYEQNILVLPVKHHIPYGENTWIYLGAMEQLIAKLSGLPNSVFVYQGTYIPHLLHTARLEREFDSQDISKIFDVSGASLVVETEIFGNTADYKLVYKFHLNNDVKQGVILDSSINNALSVLSNKVAAFINHPLNTRDRYSPQQEFNDALFAEAMISYESDWQTSISFFESYLALNPNSVTALIYLSKLYLWQGNIEQANKLMERTKQLEVTEALDKANLELLNGKIVAKRGNWQHALQLYQHAANMIEQESDWFLKASIAEEQGLVYLEQKMLDKSLDAFQLALSYYRIIQSPIGINSTRLHLAEVFFRQDEKESAQKYYLAAKQSIDDIQLDFLFTMLNEYEQKFIVDFNPD